MADPNVRAQFNDAIRKRLGVSDLSAYFDSVNYESDWQLWQASRTATLLEAAAAMCEGCREGWPLGIANRAGDWHDIPKIVNNCPVQVVSACLAKPIRRLLEP